MKEKDRFMVRLTRENLSMFEEFLRADKFASGKKSQAVNIILARYFLYEKYKGLLEELERHLGTPRSAKTY